VRSHPMSPSLRPLTLVWGNIDERTNELTAFIVGAAIGYFTGDPLRLLEDAQVLKPLLFPAVPRVLNRIALALQQAAAVPGARGEKLRVDFWSPF
jgi:long-chain acyl-CoA synthetase